MRENARNQILIVDDEPELVSLLSEMLAGEAFRVVTAASPQEALMKANNQRFCAILLDIGLGHQSGEEVILSLRNQTGLNSQTPVLVISGGVSPGLIQRIGPMIQGILLKPFRLQVLLERLSKLLNPEIATAPPKPPVEYFGFSDEEVEIPILSKIRVPNHWNSIFSELAVAC